MALTKFPTNLGELKQLIIDIWRPTINNKQDGIQFQDNGVDSGTKGRVTSIDITGAGATVTVTGSNLTVDIPGGGGSPSEEYNKSLLLGGM